VSPKILSPQPSRILRLSSQRTTNTHLIWEQVIAEFYMSTPNGSFNFQEVPSYLTLHNLSLPEYTPSKKGRKTETVPLKSDVFCSHSRSQFYCCRHCLLTVCSPYLFHFQVYAVSATSVTIVTVSAIPIITAATISVSATTTAYRHVCHQNR
jgi:hypothetical protein